MFGSDVVYYWLTHGQGNAYLNQSLTDLREGARNQPIYKKRPECNQDIQKKCQVVLQDASSSSATEDCTMIFSFCFFIQCSMHCMTIISTNPPPQRIFCRRNRRTTTGAETRDKEHRHFFSWTLPVRVVESLQFLGHLHPAAKFVLLSCCSGVVYAYEMQHEKDFTLAFFRVYSKILKSMAAFWVGILRTFPTWKLITPSRPSLH